MRKPRIVLAGASHSDRLQHRSSPDFTAIGMRPEDTNFVGWAVPDDAFRLVLMTDGEFELEFPGLGASCANFESDPETPADYAGELVHLLDEWVESLRDTADKLSKWADKMRDHADRLTKGGQNAS